MVIIYYESSFGDFLRPPLASDPRRSHIFWFFGAGLVSCSFVSQLHVDSGLKRFKQGAFNGNPRPFCAVGNATRIWCGVHCQSAVATTKLLLLLFACQTYQRGLGI